MHGACTPKLAACLLRDQVREALETVIDIPCSAWNDLSLAISNQQTFLVQTHDIVLNSSNKNDATVHTGNMFQEAHVETSFSELLH